VTRAEFIAKATMHMVSKGVDVHLVSNKTVTLTDKCEALGYYCDEDKEFKCATGNSESFWFEVFVHEYCHFLQDIEGSFSHYPAEAWEDFQDWLDKRTKLTPDKVEEYLSYVRGVEVDCEKRVVKLTNKYDLPIDTGLYIKKANIHGLIYTIAAKHRRWPKAAMSDPTLLSLVPKGFKRNWDSIPKGFEEIIVEKYFASKA